jgi:calcineurin-like phosphoesterase
VVGGPSVEEWAYGPLNQMLKDQIEKLKNKYQVDLVIWHQGETDFSLNTPQKNIYAI